jgi:flagellar basal-body rod protein FlgF
VGGKRPACRGKSVDKYLYVAMTGASQNALAQKAHANNLANISTNGFQKDLEQARSMPVFGDSFPARAFAMSERPAKPVATSMSRCKAMAGSPCRTPMAVKATCAPAA